MDGTQASALQCVHYSWMLPESQHENVFKLFSVVPCPACHPKFLLFVGLPSQAQSTRGWGKVALQRDTGAPLHSTGLAGNTTLCSTQKGQSACCCPLSAGLWSLKTLTRRNHGIYFMKKNMEECNSHSTEPGHQNEPLRYRVVNGVTSSQRDPDSHQSSQKAFRGHSRPHLESQSVQFGLCASE